MDPDVETLLRLAIEQLRDGRHGDALLTLERTVDPKFGDPAFADGQYRMFDPYEAISPMRDALANGLGMQVKVLGQ